MILLKVFKLQRWNSCQLFVLYKPFRICRYMIYYHRWIYQFPYRLYCLPSENWLVILYHTDSHGCRKMTWICISNLLFILQFTTNMPIEALVDRWSYDRNFGFAFLNYMPFCCFLSLLYNLIAKILFMFALICTLISLHIYIF